MGGDEDRLSPLLQPEDQVIHETESLGVELTVGLIEQDDRGLRSRPSLLAIDLQE